jgi:uncharacterized membrane protein
VNWPGLLLVRLPLALWVGGGIVAGALVAPTLFRTLPSRDQSGALFGAVLQKLEGLYHVLSVILIFGIFEQVSVAGRIEGRSLVTAVGAFLAIAANVYASMVIRPRLSYYRAQVGSFDLVSNDNPWRKKFDRAHRRSETVMSLGMLCAALALIAAP